MREEKTLKKMVTLIIQSTIKLVFMIRIRSE